MKLEDIQTAIESMTVGRKSKDRRTFLVVLDDGQTVAVRRIGIGWDLVVQLSSGTIYTMPGKLVRAQVSWRDPECIEITVGEMSGPDFRPRGSFLCRAEDVVSIEEADHDD